MKSMKNMNSFHRLSQNVYVLYFLFIATLVHLGYFVIHSETQSIILFALIITFVYLIHKNMVIVLGVSIVFTDLFYLIQHMHEGFSNKESIDSSGCKDDPSGCKYDPSLTDIEASGNVLKSMNTQKTLSGNKSPTEKMTNQNKTSTSNTSGNSSTGKTSGNTSTSNTSGNRSIVKITPTSTPVNPIVQAAETIGKNTHENMEGRDLNDVQQDSVQMKNMINQLKASPEIAESFKQIPGLDISELNRLMNNLNKVVDSFA